jgi:hypothetical protein
MEYINKHNRSVGSSSSSSPHFSFNFPPTMHRRLYLIISTLPPSLAFVSFIKRTSVIAYSFFSLTKINICPCVARHLMCDISQRHGVPNTTSRYDQNRLLRNSKRQPNFSREKTYQRSHCAPQLYTLTLPVTSIPVSD